MCTNEFSFENQTVMNYGIDKNTYYSQEIRESCKMNVIRNSKTDKKKKKRS